MSPQAWHCDRREKRKKRKKEKKREKKRKKEKKREKKRKKEEKRGKKRGKEGKRGKGGERGEREREKREREKREKRRKRRKKRKKENCVLASPRVGGAGVAASTVTTQPPHTQILNPPPSTTKPTRYNQHHVKLQPRPFLGSDPQPLFSLLPPPAHSYPLTGPPRLTCPGPI